MSAPLKLMICAAEPSGDALGGALMTALRNQRSDIRFFGCGGPEMGGAGLKSIVDIESFAVMGPVAALRAVPQAFSAASRLARLARTEAIDGAILIDSWAFSKLVAERLRKVSPQTKIYKYVAPQVWASRPERAEKLAKLFDGLVTLFDFETPWFENHGIRTIAAGHPGFQKLTKEADRAQAFRRRHGLADAPLLLLAPGSRRAEIKWLSEPFRAAVDIIKLNTPTLNVAVSVAPGRLAEIEAAFGGWTAKPVFVGSEEKVEAFGAADAALVASGTASTEIAICKTPMVVAYRGDMLTAVWAKRVKTSDYASLINIALGRRVIPEFIQEECTAPALASALELLFNNDTARRAQLEAFPEALAKLGATGDPAAEIAAKAFISWIEG